jgi:hypothetical protein
MIPVQELLPGEKALWDALEGEIDIFLEGLSTLQRKDFAKICDMWGRRVEQFRKRRDNLLQQRETAELREAQHVRDAFECGWNTAIEEIREQVRKGNGDGLLVMMAGETFSFPPPVYEKH